MAIHVLTAVVVALGIALRARGYLDFTLPFWLDEAAWGIYLMEEPLASFVFRPIGFMAISMGLAVLLSPSETVLRFLPFVGGVGSVLLALPLARLLYRAPAAQLLFVAVIALHPGAIDLSKEFKPYSVALFAHLFLMLVTLRYVSKGTSGALAWVLGTTLGALLFTQDIVFAFPGVFLVLALTAWRLRDMRQGVAIVGGGLFLILLLGGFYLLLWHKVDRAETEYWGDKYDVFVNAEGLRAYFDWWFGKYTYLTTLPGHRRMIWEGGLVPAPSRELGYDYGWIWMFLHVVGLGALAWQRRGIHLLLLGLPLVVTTVFNKAGFWPFGLFRTNLFLLAYFAAIAAHAFDLRADRKNRWLAPLPTLVLVLAPLVLFERTWHVRKRTFASHNDFPRATEKLLERQLRVYEGKPQPLLLDSWTCEVWDYYTKYNPHFSRELGPILKSRFEPHCVRATEEFIPLLQHHLKTEPRVWIFASKPRLVDGLNGKAKASRLVRHWRTHTKTEGLYEYGNAKR